jgi:hypothetical protein
MQKFFEYRDKLYEEHSEYCKVNQSDDSFSDWLIEKLTEAEERASHHAEIASVCSAAAERYAAALDSIAEVANFNIGARITEIRRILKEARKEAE